MPDLALLDAAAPSRTCPACARALPATEFNRKYRACYDCRSMVPARPLFDVIAHVAARAGWTRASVCLDAGLSWENVVSRWERAKPSASLEEADAVLDGTYRHWWDVFTPVTVACPYALARCEDLFEHGSIEAAMRARAHETRAVA